MVSNLYGVIPSWDTIDVETAGIGGLEYDGSGKDGESPDLALKLWKRGLDGDFKKLLESTYLWETWERDGTG